MNPLERFRPKSIRTEMVLVFTGLFAAVITLIVSIDMFGVPGTPLDGQYGRARAAAYGDLTFVADLQQRELLDWMQARETEIAVLSSNATLRTGAVRLGPRIASWASAEDAVTAGHRAADTTEGRLIHRRLVTLVEEFRVYENIDLVDAATGIVFVSSRKENLGKSLAADPVFLGAHLSRGSYAGDVALDPVSGKPLFPLAHPIRRDNGEVASVIILYVDAETMLAPVRELGQRLSSGAEAILFNQQARILTELKHPLADDVEARPFLYRMDTRFAALAASGSECLVESKDYRGKDVLAAVRQIRVNSEWGWGLAVVVSKAEIFGPLRRDIFLAAGTGLLGILLTVLLVSLLSGQFTAPIHRLSQTADRLRRGNLDVRTGLSGENEIAQLAQVFDRMADRIQETLERLETEIDERKRTQEKLAEATREAEAANQAKSSFLSNMSHELRTPLNGVLGYSQILQRDPSVTPKQRQSLDAIASCGQHLLTLINDVLDLSKIEAGRIEVMDEPVDVATLLGNVRDIVRPKAEAKGLAFHLDIDPDTPRGIVSDGTKLKQVLVNLAGNAVKFTDKGEVRVRAKLLSSGELSLAVEDTGLGMTLEEQSEVFEAFKQAEGGRRSGGTGLGLPISKRLVEALGGRLEVTSARGQGSRFAVLHPVREVPTDELEAMTPESSIEIGIVRLPEDHAPIRALIVDDAPENRDILKQLMEDAGFRTTEAENGLQAVELARIEKPELILMDLRMPGMSGDEATRILRQEPAFADTVIIAVTASVFEDLKDHAEESGFTDYIVKPFRASELFHKIGKHLGVELVRDMTPSGGSRTVSAVTQGAEASAGSPAAGGSLANAAGYAARMRAAAEIGDVNGLSALAEELASVAGGADTAERLQALLMAFDFAGAKALADDLENT